MVGLIVLGDRRYSVVGISVFVRLPISLCTGEHNLSFIGVFRNSSHSLYYAQGSALSSVAFLIKFLTVCTAYSAKPFDCG